jgi:excisionase family DNA binding protein
MPTMITTHEPAVQQALAALMPSAHDVALAVESSRRLSELAEITGDVQLTLTGEGGQTGQIKIPASALRLLFAALSEMSCGNAVSLLPLSAEVTTQQAADILNVSRPYVVGLLEKGEIPFRKVGVQRRVRLQHLLEYKTRSDIDRRAALNELTQLGQDMGVGYELL